ncbi:MAG: carboxypeptidase-like regulatory domain-containing protein, partial [Candidatus Methylomirabilales bacterium]
MRSKGLLLMLCFTLTVNIVALAACGPAPEKSGPFRGQVVDLETGKPIPDAAILVVWWEAIFSPTGHPTRKFYEAREGVTDPEGRFEIPQLSLSLWKLGIQPAEVIFFAPGYIVHAEVVNPPDGTPFVDP